MNRCPEIFLAALFCLWVLPISASASAAEVAGSADDTLGLAEALEIAFDHCADNGSISVTDLGQNAVHHLRLPFVFFATVLVAAIDHD